MKLPATDKKYSLKTFAIVTELLVRFLLIFIEAILLVVFRLPVMVLTMFQVDLDLIVDFNIKSSKYFFFATVVIEDKILQYFFNTG